MQRDAKKTIIKKYGKHDGDTGSAQVQVALLTERINQLTEHLKIHKKDKHSRFGLMKLVGARRRHLHYLKHNKRGEYEGIIEKLKLRK